MMEKEITISARPVDQKLVEAAAKSAAAEFEKTAGHPVTYTINTELAAGRWVSFIFAVNEKDLIVTSK